MLGSVNGRGIGRPVDRPARPCWRNVGPGFCIPRECRKTASRLTIRAQVVYGEEPSVALDTYLALGLSHCFEKDDEGKLGDKFVIEPIAASSLECMANGAKTSFKYVTGITLQDALGQDLGALPKEFGDALFCEDFPKRCEASARTWTRPHAQDNLMDIVPLGQLKGGFNFDLKDKRVLNFENIVSDEDNIKQDMSIDVYGRAEKEEAEKEPEAKEAEASEATAGTDAEAGEEDEEDELDALLSA